VARICIIPRVDGLAGVAAFRIKFEEGLQARGHEVTHDLATCSDVILVLAGTRALLPLWNAQRRGTRIVQRLDGINWVHRRRNTGVRHFIRAEYGNYVLSLIRSRLAGRIIYQSAFARTWWEDWYGKTRVPSTVIHNGVDLKVYSAMQGRDPSHPPYRFLLVEGNLGGGYDMGLENAVELAATLKEKHGLPIELIVAGNISAAQRARIESGGGVSIQWMGRVPREQIPELDRSAHLLFSADLHPACPNSVIEALACGLPVLAFDTGALSELVVGEAGRLVPYGGDPWKIEKPDIPALAEAALEVLRDQPRFRRAARAHAEAALDLDKMVSAYLKALLED
jgi:glycosyltransferase involved in cell wall biosynthesis